MKWIISHTFIRAKLSLTPLLLEEINLSYSLDGASQTFPWQGSSYLEKRVIDSISSMILTLMLVVANLANTK